MAASVLPMHTGPDGHEPDGSVKKVELPEWTPLWLILVLPCTLELMITYWMVLRERQSRKF